MKGIFIENDSLVNNEKTLFNLKSILEDFDIEIVDIKSEIWRLDRGEMMEIVYDTDYAIISNSVYTISDMADSKRQLVNLLGGAGRNDIKNKTYINLQFGVLEDTIAKILMDEDYAKQHINILLALTNNNIVSLGEGGLNRIIPSTDFTKSLIEKIPFKQ
jgi:hypothetical protein